jgi:predicted DNA-binding transcriptional regulator
MITLSDDEVALLRSLLTSLRSIKVRDIDRALVILAKNDAKPNRGGN